MDVAVRDTLLGVKSLDELAEKVKALGLRKIELWIGREMVTCWKEYLAGEKKQKEFAEKLRSLGLEICAGLTATHLANADAVPEIEYVVNTARLIHTMGLKTLRIDVTGASEKENQPWQEYLARAVKSVNECVKQTGDIKTEFAVENHGSISNRAEFLKGLFTGVGSPRLGLCLDTGNFYWYGYPLSKIYEIIEELGRYTKHTHVKNINYPIEISEKTREMGYEYGKYVSPIPEGNIDLSRIVKILKKEGFKGSLCIEDESLGKFPEDKRMGVLKEDADFLKSLL